MHPEFNKARREARTEYIRKQYQHLLTTRYTDASPYQDYPAHAVSVIDAAGKELSAATTLTTSTETAEEVAIALAATTGEEHVTIITDSQTACRSYLKGRISQPALHILQRNPNLPTIQIIWSPGHTTLEGNEAAHAAAREHSHRAVSERAHNQQTDAHPKPIPLYTYAEILSHYRQARRKYPAPHQRLEKEDATTLRRLQTNTYPHNSILHAMYPTQYTANCKYCPQTGTLYHIVWECPHTPELAPIPNPSFQQWVELLTSPDLSDQHTLVERARTAGRLQGVLD